MRQLLIGNGSVQGGNRAPQAWVALDGAAAAAAGGSGFCGNGRTNDGKAGSNGVDGRTSRNSEGSAPRRRQSPPPYPHPYPLAPAPHVWR